MGKPEYKYVSIFIIAFAITAVLFTINTLWIRTYGGDTEWYVKAANGDFQELIQPYAGRFLHPFIVGMISRLFSLDIYHSFLVVGILSVFLFFILVGIMLKKTVSFKYFMLVPLFLSPYFLTTVREIFEPDAFYIFLSALFLLLLLYKKEIAGLTTLFLLFLSRESTIILSLIFGVISWMRSRKFLAITILLLTLMSVYVIGVIGGIGQPNIHGLGGATYLFSKTTYNFLTNVLGVKAWTNTYDNCSPVWKFHNPFPIGGGIREVGFCGFNFLPPLSALVALLSVFGVAPLVCFYIFFKKRKYILEKLPLWCVVALGCGLIYYFFGIVAGTGVRRILGYGWPAFLLITPIFVWMFFEIDKNFVFRLTAAQLFVAWLPLLAQRAIGDTIPVALGLILIFAAIYYWLFRTLRRQKLRVDGRELLFG